ncbi:MAG: hypothetical protein GY791_00440 [Alphaproteobacteria bacterium]|nr:hypothetical protein [Alphaproteobacteria bacterium]
MAFERNNAMPKLNNIRLSFVWVDTIPGLLDGAAPAAELAWLGRRGDFVYEFDRRQQPYPIGDALDMPWRPPDSGRGFWRHYFEDKRPAAVNGNQAWKNLAPLREDVSRSSPDGEAFTEMRVSALYFPHGMALVLTLNLRDLALDLMAATKRAMTLRHDQVLTLADEPGKRYSLDVLGNTIRDRLRGTHFAGLASHAGRDQPFSVVTVLEAADVDPLAAVVDGDETHRALEAMTGWNPHFEAVDLANAPIAKARVERRTSKGLDSDLFYARKSGVAIWLPRELDRGPKGRTALSCFHNNLLHGTVQTRSLAEFVHWTRREAAKGVALSNAVTKRVQRAETLIAMIKAGKYVTYRSRCLALQIAQALPDG